MADNIIRTIYVELKSRSDQILKDFKGVEKKTNALTKGFKRMGLALVGAFGARAVLRGFQQTLKATDQLIKTSKGVGFAVSEYEELIFALDQVGVSAGSAKIALGDFQKRLSKAIAGTSPQFAKDFKKAGLDIEALGKLSPAKAFDAAMIQLAALPENVRAGLTGGVLEEQSAKDALQVFRQWPKYAAARLTFQKRIGSLTRGETRDIEVLNEEMKVYTAQWETIKKRVVAQTGPALLSLFDQLAEQKVFEGIAGEISEFVTQLNGLLKDLREIKTAWDLLFADSPAAPDASPIKKFLSIPLGGSGPGDRSPANIPLGGSGPGDRSPANIPVPPDFPGGMTGVKGVPGNTTIVNQNNKFVITDRETGRAADKGVQKAMERIQRAP